MDKNALENVCKMAAILFRPPLQPDPDSKVLINSSIWSFQIYSVNIILLSDPHTKYEIKKL